MEHVKQKRYWLRGGFAGLIIVVVNIILIGPFGPLSYFFGLSQRALKFSYILPYTGNSIFVTHLIMGFILGSVFGWIYGRTRRGIIIK